MHPPIVRAKARRWGRGTTHLEVDEVAQVLDFLDDVVVQLQLDQLVEAHQIIYFQDVLVRQQQRPRLQPWRVRYVVVSASA